jgi:hypothetical protein
MRESQEVIVRVLGAEAGKFDPLEADDTRVLIDAGIFTSRE